MIPKIWYCINTDRTNSNDALFWHTIFSIFLNAALNFTSYIYATECETCILWKITNVRIIYCNGNKKTKSYLNCVCLCTGLVKKYIYILKKRLLFVSHIHSEVTLVCFLKKGGERESDTRSPFQRHLDW